MKTGLRASGFSLIELMIVLAILAIAMMFAIPQYQQYTIRGHRTNGAQFLLDLAQRQEQFLLDRRQYAQFESSPPAPFGSPHLNLPLPADVAEFYNLVLCESVSCPIAWAGGRPAFQAMLVANAGGLMTADRIGGVAGSGRLFVNSRGERWREADPGCAVDTCTFVAGTDKRIDEK